MIICQCNVLSCTQLKSATERLSACDPHCIVTPGAVFRACGARPQCGGCMLNVTEVIVGAMQQRQQLDKVINVVSLPVGIHSNTEQAS